MGLSAEELSAETLYPGDTIEYFSMAFVSGDPRGHRVAKVLKVLKGEPEYPLRLESQEMLPVTLMIRRKLDRHGDEVDSDTKWRKIRTFKLVTGEVQGKTRADRLNEGLKQSMTSAIQAAKATFAAQRAEDASDNDDSLREEKEKKKAKKKKKTKAEVKPERFQQQQLSFFKRDAVKDKDEEKQRDEVKRFSLDSMSRREPLRNDEDKSALKHKKPRILSLSSASASSSQTARGVHQSSPLPKKKRPAEAAQPSSRSKYFASSRSSSQKSPYKSNITNNSKTPPKKKIPLRQFVDAVEERKKSSLDMTLDEYLAKEEQRKKSPAQQQQLKRSSRDDTASNRTDKLSSSSTTSSSTTSSSKWERERNSFRAKTQTENGGNSSKWRIDSQSMDRWLTSGKPQQQQPQKSEAPSPPRGRGASSAANHPYSGRSSLEPRPRLKVSGLRNGSSSSSRPQSPPTKDLDFMMSSPPSAKPIEKRPKYQLRDDDDDSDSDEGQQTARKRKRSSDFASPGKRSTTPHKSSDRRRDRGDVRTPDLMNAWISKKRD